LKSAVERFDGDAPAAAYEPPLLAGFPDAAAIGIRPRVTTPPLVRVGVGVESEISSGAQPILRVAQFDDLARFCEDSRRIVAARRFNIGVDERTSPL
jgi:hypothetical protein